MIGPMATQAPLAFFFYWWGGWELKVGMVKGEMLRGVFDTMLSYNTAIAPGVLSSTESYRPPNPNCCVGDTGDLGLALV